MDKDFPLDDIEQEIGENVVKGEADRSELMELINQLTSEKVTPDAILEVFKAMPEAYARLLQLSASSEDGSKRCEIFGGDIIRVVRKPASVGTGLAEGVNIPEHFAVYRKSHKVALDAMEGFLGLPCRNG